MNAVVDRVVQYPHRYQLKNVSTGEILGTFDLEPITGTISVVGTKIDKALFDSIATDIGSRLVSNGGDAKDNIITYTIASDRNNIVSGEKLSVSFGKIAKYLNDLKAIAFSGNKADIGLGNVDNTSDMDKPISTAMKNALDLKANKSDLSSVAKGLDKSLYNLGAFDTISGNVITRQTGYLNLSKVSYQGSTTWIDYTGFKIPVTSGIVASFIASITYYQNADSGWISSGLRLSWTDTNTAVGPMFRLYLGNETFVRGVTDDIEIQYKLATSYTEEIIEGQPLITLDSQGSQWLRSEWEKGLNLADFPNRTGRWWVTKQDDISEFINQLPNGTYNISVDCTPLSIDIGNVTDFFFWLQIYGGQYSSGDGIHTEIGNFTALNQTHRGYLTFTKQSYTNYVFRLWGFGNHDGGNHGEGKCSNIMLNEGTEPLPYQEYNGSIVREKEFNEKLDELKKEIDLKANNSDLLSHTNNTNNPHNVTKEQLGLGNVNNTSDADKPVSIATQNALNNKADKSEVDKINQNIEAFVMPAVKSISFDAEGYSSTWNSKSSYYEKGEEIAYLRTDENYNKAIKVLPVNSYKSVSEAKIEYISGDNNYISYGLKSISDSLDFIPTNISNGQICAEGYRYSSQFTPRTTTFRITIRDTYDNYLTKDFTIKYYTK